MSDAPEEIVASVDYENINGTRLRVGCVTVGTDGVPHPFDPVHYIRRDIHRALLKAEREAGEREGREEALREAVDIAHDHKGFRPAAAWSDDECQGYQNGQIDIQSAISDALRALAEKDATP